MLRFNQDEKRMVEVFDLLATPGAARALHAIRLHGVIRERDIASRTLVPANIVRDIVVRAESLKLIERHNRSGVILYTLTPFGAESLVGADVVRASVMRECHREDEMLPDDYDLDSSVRNLLEYYRATSVPARAEGARRIGRVANAIRLSLVRGRGGDGGQPQGDPPGPGPQG